MGMIANHPVTIVRESGMFKITQSKGFQITYPNGYTVSVQWGPGNYCDNRYFEIGRTNDSYFDACVKAGEDGSPTAETAIFDVKDNFVKRSPDDYDSVQAHQTPAEVLATMAWAASLPSCK